MNKYNTLNKGLTYNNLGKVKYHSQFKKLNLTQLMSRVGPRPIVLSEDFEQIAILETSYDVILEQEVQGIDELTFSIALSDRNRQLIQNEGYIQMFDTIYIVREISDDKGSNNSDVYCEALWYDLQYSEPFDPEKIEWVSQEQYVIMRDILENTGWSVGKIDTSGKKTLRVDIDTNKLDALRRFEKICGGELVFNTIDKTVDMIVSGGENTGASIMYEKNATNMEAHYDTRELITKIVPYGKDGMTIAEANDGVIFLENYSYTKNVRYQVIKDERYTNPYELKTMCEQALAELAKPRVSYITTMRELISRSGLEHEQFFIGGIVRVYDKELGIDRNTRIMKWKLNVSEPWDSDVELESKTKNLSELLTGRDGSLEQFDSGIGKSELMNLSIYNSLLNSRADDGFFSWANSGWTVDPSKGASGNSSFKAIGEMGKTKEIKQTCYPASRDSYSISFMGATENLVKGENAKIGVEVVINYEDGTSDTKFISLI